MKTEVLNRMQYLIETTSLSSNALLNQLIAEKLISDTEYGTALSRLLYTYGKWYQGKYGYPAPKRSFKYRHNPIAAPYVYRTKVKKVRAPSTKSVSERLRNVESIIASKLRAIEADVVSLRKSLE